MRRPTRDRHMNLPAGGDGYPPDGACLMPWDSALSIQHVVDGLALAVGAARCRTATLGCWAPWTLWLKRDAGIDGTIGA